MKNSATYEHLRRMRGVGLVTAIFLLVVLAGLGVAMVTVFTSQQATSAMDEQGARAYQAARAGIEWGVYRQLIKNQCAAQRTFPLPANTTLSSFSVTVRCQKVTTSGIAIDRYVISAAACNQPGPDCPSASNSPDYVARQIEVEL